MIHPSSLLRTHSNAEAFSAPRNVNLELNNFDCGLKVVPWLTPALKLEKYAKTSVFVSLFCCLGFLQGILQTYFNSNSQHFHINTNIVDWVLIAPNVFIGLFGLFIAYFGNRIHRPTWLGSLAILQAISAWTLIIPEMYHPQCRDQDFCTKFPSCSEKLVDDVSTEKSYITTSFLFTYQLFFSFSFISYATFGLTYIDDHINIRYSAAYLCIELLFWKIGEYFGLFLSLIPIHLKRNVFFSFVWLICVSLLFVVGVLICLFPKVLPSKIEKNGVDSILHETNGDKQYTTDKLWHVLKRLLQERTLMVTILIATLASIATTNFNLVQDDYFQSNFFIPSKNFISITEPISLKYLFKFSIQPIICFGLMITGLFIIKFKPSAKMLVIYLIVLHILITISFLILSFLNCEEKIYMKFGSFSDICNRDCHCNKNMFSPVCLNGRTYFSPCFAGCAENNLTSCLCSPGVAKLDSCKSEKCNFIWSLAQLNELFRNGILYSILLLQLFLCLRVVKENDKSMALALYFVIIYFVPIIPFKIILDKTKKIMCLQKNENNDCIIYNGKFIILITSAAVVWTCLSVIYCFMLYFSKIKISMYKNVRTKSGSSTTREYDVIHEVIEEKESSSILQSQDGNEITSALNETGKTKNGTNSRSDVGYSDEDINAELSLLENNENNTNNVRFSETQF